MSFRHVIMAAISNLEDRYLENLLWHCNKGTSIQVGQPRWGIWRSIGVTPYILCATRDPLPNAQLGPRLATQVDYDASEALSQMLDGAAPFSRIFDSRLGAALTFDACMNMANAKTFKDIVRVVAKYRWKGNIRPVS